jgi:hypothetical protein
MISAHLAGVNHAYKVLNRTPAKCLVCGQFSECRIMKYERSTRILFVKVKALEEQFIFDWEGCNHRAVLFDRQDVSRYKAEQVETGSLLVPYYRDMKLRTMAMPKKVSWVAIALVVGASLIAGVLLAMLMDRLGVPFVP